MLAVVSYSVEVRRNLIGELGWGRFKEFDQGHAVKVNVLPPRVLKRFRVP